MTARWKRLSAERIESGEWSELDAREMFASLKEAMESGDAVRQADAFAYVQAEAMEFEWRDEKVREAVGRMRMARSGQ